MDKKSNLKLKIGSSLSRKEQFLQLTLMASIEIESPSKHKMWLTWVKGLLRELYRTLDEVSDVNKTWFFLAWKMKLNVHLRFYIWWTYMCEHIFHCSAKTTYSKSGVSAAVLRCVYIWLSLI